MVILLSLEHSVIDPNSPEMLSDIQRREIALLEKGIPVFGTKEEAKGKVPGGFVWESKYGGYIPVNQEAGRIYAMLILESKYESIFGKKLPKFDEKTGKELTLDQKMNIAQDGLKTYQEYCGKFAKNNVPKFANQTGLALNNPREQIEYMKRLINEN